MKRKIFLYYFAFVPSGSMVASKRTGAQDREVMGKVFVSYSLTGY